MRSVPIRASGLGEGGPAGNSRVADAAHAVFRVLVAALIALLLGPVVRTLGVFRVRRGISVALVYITFAGALLLILVAVTTVVVGQTRTAANRFNHLFADPHGRT